jgi:hypothetical protein
MKRRMWCKSSSRTFYDFRKAITCAWADSLATKEFTQWATRHTSLDTSAIKYVSQCNQKGLPAFFKLLLDLLGGVDLVIMYDILDGINKLHEL